MQGSGDDLISQALTKSRGDPAAPAIPSLETCEQSQPKETFAQQQANRGLLRMAEAVLGVRAKVRGGRTVTSLQNLAE